MIHPTDKFKRNEKIALLFILGFSLGAVVAGTSVLGIAKELTCTKKTYVEVDLTHPCADCYKECTDDYR